MDDRRKAVGRRIARARRRHGFSSQAAFAPVVHLSEASVANAERGSDRVGDTVFTAIEGHFGWREGAIMTYIETGDEAGFPDDSATPDGADTNAADRVQAADRDPAGDAVRVDDLPPELIRRWVRVGYEELDEIQESRGPEWVRTVEDRLIELAALARRKEQELRGTPAEDGHNDHSNDAG